MNQPKLYASGVFQSYAIEFNESVERIGNEAANS